MIKHILRGLSFVFLAIASGIVTFIFLFLIPFWSVLLIACLIILWSALKLHEIVETL